MMRPLYVSLVLLLPCFQGPGPQELPRHRIVPLRRIPSIQSVEVVSGDPAVPGAPFVIRIQNDAGYVILPHTHPTDENIVVLQGRWSLATGPRYDPATLQPLDVGAYAFVPARMPHFGRAETEIVEQVHGIGPFSTDYVDPVFELAPGRPGACLIRTPGGRPTCGVEVPSACFSLRLGDVVDSPRGNGAIVGALCSPINAFTQYWVERHGGERYWAVAAELRRH